MSRSAIVAAVQRARRPIMWIGFTYLIGVFVGAVMAHAHSAFALQRRDELVGRSFASDPAAIALQQRLLFRAALLDFGGNLCLGAVPSTIMGLAVVPPFLLGAYRGWVGGIVSVDGRHQSRLRAWPEAVYYLGVLFLQLIPYLLAGGAGIRLGLALVFPKGPYGYATSDRWAGLPAEGVRDVVRIYALVIPLFLVASLVEFLVR